MHWRRQRNRSIKKKIIQAGAVQAGGASFSMIPSCAPVSTAEHIKVATLLFGAHDPNNTEVQRNSPSERLAPTYYVVTSVSHLTTSASVTHKNAR